MAFNIFGNNGSSQGQQIYEALGRSMAVIEFSLDGKILTANANFLSTMGYELGDIVGKQHAIFVTADYAKARNTSSSGKPFRMENSSPMHFNVCARTGIQSGLKRPITRS